MTSTPPLFQITDKLVAIINRECQPRIRKLGCTQCKTLCDLDPGSLQGLALFQNNSPIRLWEESHFMEERPPPHTHTPEDVPTRWFPAGRPGWGPCSRDSAGPEAHFPLWISSSRMLLNVFLTPLYKDQHNIG